MTYQYFTPGDAEQYAYYRIPKMLITDKQFRGITMEAKLLYGILLDRVSLSLKNGWVDENNHVYIIFTIEQIMQEMNCGNKKAVSLLSELEKKIHLVEKKRQGLGKPNLLYVKNFFLCNDIHTDGTEIVDNYPSVGKGCAEMSEGNAQRCQKDTSVGVVEEALEVSKGHGTNTNITKTDMSNTDPILSYPSGDGNSVKEPEHRIDGLILGTPGSGKSFSAKREMLNAFVVTKDDIIICDPEAEYTALVNKLKGQVIKISPSSTQYINPMDINDSYSEEDDPTSLKSDFILSLCELVVGGKDGLLPVEKTVIDRCVHQIYQKYFEDPVPEKMPILEDLYNALLLQEEKEARHVATALEIYVKGSLNLFNHRTNVDINNRIVCYDIKELGKQLKKIGMLIVQDQVWGRVTANRSAGRTTRYYMDEFHLLLKEEQTAAYSVEIWKRFRKWGGIPTAITQNVKDLLASREVENIFGATR